MYKDRPMDSAEIKPSYLEKKRPNGEFEKPDPNDTRPIDRQNDTARLFTKKGYDIAYAAHRRSGHNMPMKRLMLLENKAEDK